LVGDDGTTTTTIVSDRSIYLDLQKHNFWPLILREACSFLVIQFKCHSNSNPRRVSKEGRVLSSEYVQSCTARNTTIV
jgi:hypothetical protein